MFMQDAKLRHATFVVLCLFLMCGPTNTAVLKSLEVPCAFKTKPVPDPIFYHVDMKSDNLIRKREEPFSPLRFHLHFDTSLRNLPTAHQQLIRSHVRIAVEFWESTLRVRSTRGLIRLRKKCLINSTVQFEGRTAFCLHGCLDSTVCGSITIPSEHLEGCKSYNPFTREFTVEPTTSPGVTGADYVLYVATIPSRKCEEGKTVAYAAHCQQEQDLDRPVAGYFSICPNSISTSRQNQQQLLSTIKHEILHALGFTAGLYAFYRDDNGSPLTLRNYTTGHPLNFIDKLGMFQWSTAVARRVVRPYWVQKTGVTEKAVYVMVTKRVKAEVQRHFNCSSLEGAELEDQGIDGTVLTHWEKRVFENEAMTGTYTQNSVISRITLAMMEDTGWYRADYSKVGNYEWGKNLGCDFVKNSCYNWISTRLAQGESIHPFCAQVKQGELWTDCTHNRHSLALCNLVEYTRPLPGQYQYFDSLTGVGDRDVGKYGGSVKLADYCPYLQEFSWTDENNFTVRGSKCQVEENNLDPASNFFAEEYGPNSLCFEHAGRWHLRYCAYSQRPQHAGSGCYKYHCRDGEGLYIQVHYQTHRCYTEHQVINVVLQHQNYVQMGTVVCPSCRDVCQPLGIQCPAEVQPPSKPAVSVDFSFCGTDHPFSLNPWTLVSLLLTMAWLDHHWR